MQHVANMRASSGQYMPSHVLHARSQQQNLSLGETQHVWNDLKLACHQEAEFVANLYPRLGAVAPVIEDLVQGTLLPSRANNAPTQGG